MEQPSAHKRCSRCQRELPLDAFYRRRNGRPQSWCRTCLRAHQERTHPRQRPPRVNARGDLFCFHCQRYQHPSAFRLCSPPSWPRPRYLSYCRECEAALNRLRWRGERRERQLRQRAERKRRQRQAQQRERREFVASAILILRRRGLTKMEIARLAGVSLQSLLRWERQQRRPDPSVAERFVILLRETAHLPLGDQPAYRRRRPHPELPALLARTGPQLARFPVRSKWRRAGEDAEPNHTDARWRSCHAL